MTDTAIYPTASLAEKHLLKTTGCTNLQPFDAAKYPFAARRFAEMCAQIGQPNLPLYQCDLTSPDGQSDANAFYFPFHCVAISQQALKILNEDEIVAVLAHELTHARRRIGDNVDRTVIPFIAGVGAIYGTQKLLADMQTRRQSRRGFIKRLAAFTAMGFAGIEAMDVTKTSLIHHAERRADLDSLDLNPHPEHLISALRKLEAGHLTDPEPTHGSFTEREEVLRDAAKKRGIVIDP